MRFVGGLLVGLLALGAYLGYEKLQLREDPCLARCGEGTQCQTGRCLPAVAASKPRRKRRSRRRSARRRSRPAKPGQPQLRQPSAADLQARSQGPSLRKTDYLDLEQAQGATGELASEQVDSQVRRLEPQIVACIDRARGDYEISQGQVTVGLRIERSGRVKDVRVTAPALLQRAGLYGCLKPLLTSRLKFPASGRALVMTYPYALR